MAHRLLTVESLSIYFGAKKVVDNMHLQLHCGECLGVVGESGSGKSLSALAIMQLLPTTACVSQQAKVHYHQGKNIVDWLDLSERDMQRVRGKKVAMVFQDALTALDPVITLGKQMHEALRSHRMGGAALRNEKIRRLFLEVGITDVDTVISSYPHQLSGGQRQRAMIAMALCCDPDILIADEPCTALDVSVQQQVIDLLLSLKQSRQLSILFISHDLHVVKRVADRILVMHQGKLVEASDSKIFFNDPKNPYSKKLLDAVLPLHSACRPDDASRVILHVQALQKTFIKNGKKIHAVNGVTLQCREGETLALVGESGSGKSTTAKTIIGLLKKDSGSIDLETDPKQLQYIFQDPYAALNPRMMIIDCVLEGLLTQKKLCKQQRIETAENLLASVGLDQDGLYRYPHQFSGGQRQRICIARALAMQPKMLILDEPTSALDVTIQKDILRLLKKIQNALGLSYLLITHDFGVVAQLAHHVAVMREGRIVEYASCQQLLEKPQHEYTQSLLAHV